MNEVDCATVFGTFECSVSGLPRKKEKAKMSEYAIEMLGITKRFPGIIANDNITLQLGKR